MNLRHAFYVQPMNMVYLEMISMYIIWTFVMLNFREKRKRIAGTVCFVLTVGLIISYTIIGRSHGEAVSLIPFISFANAKTQPELYRTLLMNMFLFLPFGLSLPFALPDNIKHKVLWTVPAGCLFSACIEASQFFFHLGKCETDDVLMNTLGTIIGATSFLIHNAILRLIQRIKNR